MPSPWFCSSDLQRRTASGQIRSYGVFQRQSASEESRTRLLLPALLPGTSRSAVPKRSPAESRSSRASIFSSPAPITRPQKSHRGARVHFIAGCGPGVRTDHSVSKKFVFNLGLFSPQLRLMVRTRRQSQHRAAFADSEHLCPWPPASTWAASRRAAVAELMVSFGAAVPGMAQHLRVSSYLVFDAFTEVWTCIVWGFFPEYLRGFRMAMVRRRRR